MELRHLRYFVAISETRNFRRAAERLNMSQPPLTVAIRNLERELGADLFVRGTQEVTLTPAGATALSFARSTLVQADAFRTAVREGSGGQRGRLRIGFIGSATYSLLPRIIPAFRALYPAVDLALEESTSIDIARRVEAGDLDVGLVRLPLQHSVRVIGRTVDRDRFSLAVPSSHRLARRSRVSLADVRHEAFILSSSVSVLRAQALQACHDAGFSPVVTQEAAQISAILSLVRSGLGVALVPSRVASVLPEGVQLLSLAHPIPVETGLILPQDNPTPAAQRFVAVIDS